MIKFNTLLKGAIWEAIGVLILGTYTWVSTGSWQAALQIGVGYPLLRVILWYPYERIYKMIRRRKYQKQPYMGLALEKYAADLQHEAVKTQIKLECAIDHLAQGVLEACTEYINGKRTSIEMAAFNRRIDEIQQLK